MKLTKVNFIANVVVSDYPSLKLAIKDTVALVEAGTKVNLYFNNMEDAMLMPDVKEEYYLKGDLVSRSVAEEIGYIGVKPVKIIGDTIDWLSTLWTEEVADKVNLVYQPNDQDIKNRWVISNNTN